MNILDRRKEKTKAILENRFINQQLNEERKEWDKDMVSLMKRRGFKSQDFYSGRDFLVSENRLRYTHLPKHRFVDMKHLTGKHVGRYRKKAYPVHNKMIYGHLNNIMNRLLYGFTEAVKEELSQNYEV